MNIDLAALAWLLLPGLLVPLVCLIGAFGRLRRSRSRNRRTYGGAMVALLGFAVFPAIQVTEWRRGPSELPDVTAVSVLLCLILAVLAAGFWLYIRAICDTGPGEQAYRDLSRAAKSPDPVGPIPVFVSRRSGNAGAVTIRKDPA